MKNHLVSQFIIKRFSKAINIFDLYSGKIDENKRPDKVFYKKDIFDAEMESAFNQNIESRAANILDKKILNKSEICITREELLVLKRYMLICSVRTQDSTEFCKMLRSFEKNATAYIDTIKFMSQDYSILPTSKSLNITDEDLYARTLKVFATATTIKDIACNPQATMEMLAWAMPFLESYLAFWDAPEGKEYILPDCGMSSEYEGFHMITGGVDISKMSYLLAQLNNKKYEYVMLFASNQVMYENYSIFVLSSTRMLVMINPFFRLYFGQEVIMPDKTNIILGVPDIWPAIIQDRKLFIPPDVEYYVSKNHLTDYDTFIYHPKVLCNEDVIYVNALMLSCSNNIIGFNDPIKIIDSIYYFIWYQSNFNSVKLVDEDEQTVINRLINNVLNSPYHELCQYCEEHGGINHSEFIIIFERLINNIFKDFYENPYICRYYLSRPKETTKFKVLDFIGKGEEKLKVFEAMLHRIETDRKNK